MRPMDKHDLAVVRHAIETIENLCEALCNESLTVKELVIIEEDGTKFGKVYFDVSTDRWAFA